MAADRRRSTTVRVVALLAVGLGLSGCSPTSTPSTTTSDTATRADPASGTGTLTTSASTSSASTGTDQTGVDPADDAAIAALIQQINDSSTSVDGQQASLLAVVHPDFAAGQRSCPAASVTIRLDPAYPELRPDPAWTPAGATTPPSGSLYRLPALVEVYTDDLRTGTDLTLLRISVLNGTAHTFPLCLV